MRSTTAKAPKKPSGSANRAKAQVDADRQEAAQARARKAAPEWQQRFLEIGATPRDAAKRVEWANEIAGVLIWEQIVYPDVRSAAERKLILEGVRTIGMTAVKALYESRLKRIEEKLFGGAKKDDVDAGDGIEDL